MELGLSVPKDGDGEGGGEEGQIIAPCGCMPSGVCSARTMPGTATSSLQIAICTPGNWSRSATFYLIRSSCCRHSTLYSHISRL
jgi:hypothetical protein